MFSSMITYGFEGSSRVIVSGTRVCGGASTFAGATFGAFFGLGARFGFALGSGARFGFGGSFGSGARFGLGAVFGFCAGALRAFTARTFGIVGLFGVTGAAPFGFLTMSFFTST